MIIKEKTELNGFNTPKFPKLKGHVKVTLHNVHNGKNEVIEGDNIVTNAVADIFANNYLGGIDYSKMMPLWRKWFGGVLCYNQFHSNLDADKYYPYSERNNSLIAHAGQQGIDVQHDDDMRAGNPTTSAYIETENSIKQVWEWGTTHGNGMIRSLSLAHTDVGDYGLGSDTWGFKNSFVPLEPIDFHGGSWSAYPLTMFGENNVMAQYDESHALTFWVGGIGSHALGTNSDTISIYIRKLAYTKAGLYQTADITTDLQTAFEVQTPITFYGQPYYYFDRNTKYLWLFSNMSGESAYSKTNIDYCIIDCENQNLVDLGSGVYVKTLVSDTANIAPLGMENGGRRHYANLVKKGDDIYFPTSDSPNFYSSLNATGLKRISLNSASQEQIDFEENATFVASCMYGGDFIIFPNCANTVGKVINGDSCYNCANLFTPWNDIGEIYRFSSPDMPSSYAVGTMNLSYAGSANRSRYILASKLLHTTKFNLPSAITKTAGQSMTVEYTLQEVSE